MKYEERDMAGFKRIARHKAMEHAEVVLEYAKTVYGQDVLSDYGDYDGIPLDEEICNVINRFFIDAWKDSEMQKKAFEVGKALVDREMARYFADPVGVRAENLEATRETMGALYDEGTGIYII